MAGLLGFGGPKRLVFTFLAMASISEAGIGGVDDITLIVTYIVIATALVWVPVGVVVVAGERAAVILEHAPILADQPRRGVARLALAGDRCCAGRGCARSPVRVTFDPAHSSFTRFGLGWLHGPGLGWPVDDRYEPRDCFDDEASSLGRQTRNRRPSPPQSGGHAGRLRGRSYPVRRMEPGNPPRSAATLWNCSRSRRGRVSRSWSRFATGECSSRRSRSFAAPLTSWRQTLRTAHERACMLNCAATHTFPISDSSLPRIVASCSASTISTRRCRDRSNGTSSGWRRASRSPLEISDSTRARGVRSC